MTDKRLWDIQHDYYCSESNYFSNDCKNHYPRWQDFIESEGDNDFDMNLLFRFDWEAPREDDEPENPIEWIGDENYRDCRLWLFWMGQRKGLFRCTTVDVCRADEPSVREWLQKRWKHMHKLWAPISGELE